MTAEILTSTSGHNPQRHGESWPHPVIAGRKLYLRDQDELLCYDVKKK